MQIGNVPLAHKTVLAPLAGITNLPFRLMVRKVGCGLVCSEMVSANGLVRGAAKTLQLLDSQPADKPVSMQIFGADPDVMAAAATRVAAEGADIVDINFGCAVKKIIKSGSGAALMRTPRKAARIIAAVRRAVSIPLTIKIRSGWDASGSQAVQLAKIAQDCGIDALTVHPRTATQGFSGKADWRLIERIKREVTVPVIGNGDIRTPRDAADMIDQTGCDLVMIGRAAIGNPLLLQQINAHLSGSRIPRVSASDHFGLMRLFVDRMVAYFGETHACRMLRSRLTWFVKGMRHGKWFRQAVTRLETRRQALMLIDRLERLQAPLT